MDRRRGPQQQALAHWQCAAPKQATHAAQRLVGDYSVLAHQAPACDVYDWRRVALHLGAIIDTQRARDNATNV